MRLLVFDPSGNFGDKEGAGTTGWSLFVDGQLEDFGTIKSEDYTSQENYWGAHYKMIKDHYEDTFPIGVEVCVLIESYKLFAHKAQQQSWSTMDTPQLIGFLRMYCWFRDIEVYWQDPSDKQRVNDDILVKHGIFEKRGNRYYCQGKPTVIHARDAIRHGVFFYRHGKGRSDLIKKITDKTIDRHYEALKRLED